MVGCRPITQNTLLMGQIFGFSVYNEGNNGSLTRYDTNGATSTVFAVGDVCGISSGKLVLATGTTVNVGVAAAKQASSTTSAVLPYIPITDSTIFLAGTNADLTDNKTDGGTYYHISGATGVQVVDVTAGVATTTGRQVEIVKVDPLGNGGSGSGSGLRQVLCRLINTPYSNVNITA